MKQFNVISPDELCRGIEILRHGGGEGIALFMTTAREMLASGGEDALLDWLTVATPALPERERAIVLTALLCSIFGMYCFVPPDRTSPPATLH